MYLGLTYDAFFPLEKETKVPIVSLLFGLVRYADSNYASDPEDRKLVMGYCFLIYRVVVS